MDRRRRLLVVENQLLELPSLTSPVFAYSAHEDDSGLLFQDAAKAVAADADSDPVYTAVQVSGFGAVDGVQATTASRPLLRTGANGINGHNALSFDGMDDWLDLIGITAASGAKTLYVVYKPDIIAAVIDYLLYTQSGPLLIAHLTNVSGQTGYYDGAWRSIANATLDAQIMCWALGSGTGTMYRDGTSIGSAAYTDRAIGGLVGFGAQFDGAAGFVNATVGAIYCYNALHDATERGQMFAYLSQQWGITVS